MNSLTILYTDLYLRRAYRKLQQKLQPDSTLFLGDLFDGGREWGTAEYKSPDEQYKSYGQAFWRKEYVRFSNLFLQNWFQGSLASRSAPWGRRLIASVPGNHDLGFASGINPAVKARFDAYFGPMNRVDVLGNHSFVSLDTVSLSAMDQVDPKTGAHGGGDGSASATATSHLWRPVEDFLGAAKSLRHQAVQHEWQQLSGHAATRQFDPSLVTLKDTSTTTTEHKAPEVPSSQFPTVVLSHVPLYRPGNTPCGPLREGNPSISLSQGYQYQNVLTPLISSDIIKHLVPEEIIHIYSGDDHDYCEIAHSEYTGAIREITVKSMSWAMGIRKPGVQLVSLWNPIDLDKVARDALSTPSGEGIPTPKDTLQNHLCLLPDQLSIFIRYAQLLLLTLIILGINALRSPSQTATGSPDREKAQEPLLPLTTPHTDSATARARSQSTSLSANHKHSGNLSARNSYGNLPASSRSASPAKGVEQQLQQQHDPFAPPPHVLLAESDDWGMPKARRKRARRRRRLEVFVRNLLEVTVVVLGWYGVLMWRDWS